MPPSPASPGPHEGMIVRVEGGQVLEHVVIRAHALLTLLRVRAVVPGIVDHNSKTEQIKIVQGGGWIYLTGEGCWTSGEE